MLSAHAEIALGSSQPFFVPGPPLTPHLHRTSHLHPQGISIPAQGTAVLPGWFSFHTSSPCHTRESAGCIQEKGSDCKRFYCLPPVLLYCLASNLLDFQTSSLQSPQMSLAVYRAAPTPLLDVTFLHVGFPLSILWLLPGWLCFPQPRSAAPVCPRAA